MMREISSPDLQDNFKRLVRLALRLGHSRVEAEDLAQECLLALSSGSFEGKATISTWLYRVLWNKHIDLLRQKQLQLPEEPEDRTAVPTALELTELREVVRNALRGLSEIPRAVLIFRYFEELPYAEISNILDRPVGTLKADCFRALEELHGLLDRHIDAKEQI